jgi:hypothetical protein
MLVRAMSSSRVTILTHCPLLILSVVVYGNYVDAAGVTALDFIYYFYKQNTF